MKARIAACICLACLSISARGQNWLKAPIVYESMPGEIRLAGDVDQDGDVDSIRFDGSPGSGIWTQFVVLSNLSDGQFVTGPGIALPTHSSRSVLFEDVNGDGWRDVIVSTLTSSSVGPGLSVFPGQPGGTFASQVHVGLPGNVMEIRPGDANSDGVRDLAVMNFEPANAWGVRWILGSASNAFTAMPPRVFGVSQYFEGLAALDGNADGIDDVAVSHDGSVAFYFTAAGSPTVVGPTFPIVTDSSTYFVTGDIDGDSDVDLVALTSTGFTTHLLTRFRNLGGGSWAVLPVSYPNTDGDVGFLGDWDGDGSSDLFLHELGSSSGGAYEILKNDGTGSFVSMFAADTGLPSGNGGAGLFDINADGRLDFVDSVALFFGDGTFNGFVSAPAISTHPLRDWEDDGDVDIPWESGQIRKNDGRGVFTSTFVTRPPAPAGQFYGDESLIEDFDGDGLNEFLVKRLSVSPQPGCIPSFPQSCQFIDMRRFEDTGTGTAVDLGACAAPGVTIGFSSGTVFADDVDADGDLDLVGSQGLFLNDGTHFFAPPVSSFSPYFPVARGDVDADGDWDYLATYFGGTQSLAILRRVGPALFNVEVLYPLTTTSILNHRPVLDDLDDDGDLDIAVDQAPSGTTITIYANSGGTFAQGAVIPVPTLTGNTTTSAGDVDGDGLTDLALNAGYRTRIYRRTGPGFTYEAPRIYRTPPGARLLADFDGDGDRDLIGGGIVFNNVFDGPAAGLRRQYGVGLAGTAGFTPVIGTMGPLRVGSAVTVRIRQAVGSASGLLGIGTLEASTPNYGGIPGLTLYIDQVADILTLAVGGAPGAPGAGSLDLPVLIPPSLAGLHVFVQAGFGDAGAPYGISTTNGLEILIGP